MVQPNGYRQGLGGHPGFWWWSEYDNGWHFHMVDDSFVRIELRQLHLLAGNMWTYDYTVLFFSGPHEYTGIAVGGFVASRLNYIAVANITPGLNMASAENRNIYTLIIPQNFTPTGYQDRAHDSVRQVRIATFESTDRTASNVTMSQIGYDGFALMWEEFTRTTSHSLGFVLQYIDGNGNAIGQPIRFDNMDAMIAEVLMSEWFTSVSSPTPTPTPTPSPTPIASPQPGTPSTTYNLDTASSWARNGIYEAITLGIVPQALQNYYARNITRAEFTALAVLLYEKVTGAEITGRMTFNDTNDINVQKAAYIGIITGTGSNNFSPNMQFNREQAAVIISRLAETIGQPFPLSNPTFADNNEISSWARQQAGQAQAAGIMEGIGGNRFNPRGTFTREQSIITMLRLFNYLS